MLTFYNTLTRTKEPFAPRNEKNITMYVCGVTPYDDGHIGHARANVTFDILYRLLRHVQAEKTRATGVPHKVTYVRNFTDVDDKILARAQERGEEWQALAQHYIDSFNEDMKALHVLTPDIEPRVTTSIPEIIVLVEKLVDRGIAYVALDGVYYDTSRVPAHDASRCWCVGGQTLARAYEYGALSGKNKNELRRARIEEADGKRNPGDFALWKFAKPTEPATAAWDSPWGKGRPGWHIECSAMSWANLGEAIDIHGGGEDLQFPHHENEIAQSEGASGGDKPFVNYWLHNGFITVNGTKMSKSLGNFTTIKDALKKYSPEAIRLWLLQTHYRKPVDYTDEALAAAEVRMQRYMRLAQQTSLAESIAATPVPVSVLEALSDDLNTPNALAALDELPTTLEKIKAAHFLGIIPDRIPMTQALSLDSLALLETRTAARARKDWKESDRLRDELKAQGILVEDHPDGTTTWRRA